jgi:hypothetical protein
VTSCSSDSGTVVSLLQHADAPMDTRVWAGILDDLLPDDSEVAAGCVIAALREI